MNRHFRNGTTMNDLLPDPDNCTCVNCKLARMERNLKSLEANVAVLLNHREKLYSKR